MKYHRSYVCNLNGLCQVISILFFKFANTSSFDFKTTFGYWNCFLSSVAMSIHTDDVSLPRSEWCFWLVGPRGKFVSTNQKYYPDIGSYTSSVWNFCTRSSDVIWRRNQWWHRKMSAVFSGYDTDWKLDKIGPMVFLVLMPGLQKLSKSFYGKSFLI